VLVVEDEPYMAEAIRDGLRLEAIAADIAGDGDTALELLSVNAYDIAVLDRDIPGPSGDEIAESIVVSGSGMPILMLTAADRLDDKASGFGAGADDYLTKPFELRELVLRLRALDRRRARNRPPVREIAGLRLDPFRREVYRDDAIVHNLPEHGTAQLSTAIGPGSVMLTVENTGPKVPPQLVSTLTEPFQRGTERVRGDHAGVGLGLAIVKSITQAHDGTLTLAPRAAGGLCVTVQLPAAPPPAGR
jgi:CheY-like chemotaxis protein